MAQDQEDAAVKKFLRTPDLLEKLLPYLDAGTTLRLAQSKISCLVQHLKNYPEVWIKMVQRTLPGDNKVEPALYWRYWNRVRESFEGKRVKMQNLAGILKMVDDADSQVSHLRHLLDTICVKSPPDEGTCYIQIGSTSHGFHLVSPLGFLLLEEVEVALGSTLQSVSRVALGIYSNTLDALSASEALMQALAARVVRQQQNLTRMEIKWIEVRSKEDAEAFLTLMENCETVVCTGILTGGEELPGMQYHIRGNIEEGGWAAMARASSMAPVRLVIATREMMQAGKREDLKAVGRAVVDDGYWIVKDWDLGWGARVLSSFRKSDPKAWGVLEQYFDNI